MDDWDTCNFDTPNICVIHITAIFYAPDIEYPKLYLRRATYWRESSHKFSTFVRTLMSLDFKGLIFLVNRYPVVVRSCLSDKISKSIQFFKVYQNLMSDEDKEAQKIWRSFPMNKKWQRRENTERL